MGCAADRREAGHSSASRSSDDVTETTEQRTHFHRNLARWQATDPKAGACVSCHSAHTTDGDPQQQFRNDNRVRAVCSACHAVLRGGR